MKTLLAFIVLFCGGAWAADLAWFPSAIRDAEPTEVRRFDLAPGVEYGYVYCRKLFGNPGDLHVVRIEIAKARLRPVLHEGALEAEKTKRLSTTSAACAQAKALFGTNGSFFKWKDLEPIYGARTDATNRPATLTRGCGFGFTADGRTMRVGRFTAEELARLDGFLGGECVASKGKCSLPWKRPDGPKTRPEAPRTAYGQDAEGKYVWIFVTGGRRCGQKPSFGLSYFDVADLGLMFGCSEVVNFDGGGSTTLAVDRQALVRAGAGDPATPEAHPATGKGQGYEILNCTSDGRERAVLDHILFVSQPETDIK